MSTIPLEQARGIDDPRAINNRYSKGLMVAKLEKGRPDFQQTQFFIDDNYVGKPPEVQVGITNVNDNINEEFLRNSLSKLGNIRKLEIVRHPRTNAHLKMAKVQFEKASVAKNCIESYNKKSLMGCSLSVFLDIRFEKIEHLKEETINQLANPQLSRALSSNQILANHGLSTEPNVHHPHFSSQQPILPIHHAHLQNSIHPIPSPHSLEYPITTPSSLSSAIGTPEPSSRQRLEDRIAILMKQPNSILSTIVAPTAPQITPIYSAFDSTEPTHDFANRSYYHPHLGAPSKAIDKQRPDSNDYYIRQDNNGQFSSNHNNFRNHKEPYQNHDGTNNKSAHHSDHNLDDEWKLPEIKKQPLEIKLTDKQIEEEVLPYCYKVFYDELSKNLQTTIFKKLRENYGYQCLEKAQIAYKEKQDKLKIQRDKEKLEKELEKQFESKWMSKSRVSRPTEPPRPKPNFFRQRNITSSTIDGNRRHELVEQTPRRKNRSSAMAEPERRGSHNTSIDSESSNSQSGYSSSSSSSPRSSRRGARASSSSSSSRSSSVSSSVSSSSGSSSDSSQSIQIRVDKKEVKSEWSEIDASPHGKLKPNASEASDSKTKNDREQIAAVALLEMRSEFAKNEPASRYLDDADSEMETDEPIKKSTKVAGRKRKKKNNEVMGVASEYRAAKKFASGTLGSYDEDIENAIIEDENRSLEKLEPFKYPPRSEIEQQRLLDDLYGTLSEEDLEYLKQVHESARDINKSDDVMIPFGSDSANKAHLSMRKLMIEGKAAEGHPKWWRGCSRCDVIEVSDKERLKEEMNYEDLIRAEIRSDRNDGLQPTFTSSRRDQRGDQRRMLLFNNDIDRCIMKQYTTSALKMRAKNLRFSKSRIHNWGLFACENISEGDAVIEYVGEKIRPSVADYREKFTYRNLPSHDGSSYFFRIDLDVIDATLKGNKARFINHSCNPNCYARIITDGGSPSIVIYAKRQITADEEITYDYKFPKEEGESEKICCNCKAPNCNKYLN